MTVHLVTDSTSDISQARAAELGITVIPLTVRFGDEEFKDGVDIDAAAFYKRLTESSENPRTSQPSPELFTEAYSRIAKPGDTIISIHISPKLSGTMQSATLAAAELHEIHIHVVDSGSVSAGLLVLVLSALDDLKAGLSVDEVLTRLESKKPHAGAFVVLDTLTYLQRGGRIGRAQALLGGILKVKPVIGVFDGEVEAVGRVRSQAQAIDLMLQKLKEKGEATALAAFHAVSPDSFKILCDRLRREYPDLKLETGEMGPVIGTYSGPDAVGFGYITK